MLKRLLRQIAVLSALCALAVELSGAALFAWDHGSLVYLARSTPPAASQPAAAQEGVHWRLHPYFGFSGLYSAPVRPGITTNSLGFRQRGGIELPYSPQPNDFVVALFGGSVASRLAIGDLSGVAFRDVLSSLPALAGRNVVLINMAQGGGKQPQQLIELAFLIALGQHVDLVVDVDGFNEFALGLNNVRSAMHPIMPAAFIAAQLAFEHAGASVSARYHELAYRLGAAQADRQKRQNAMASARFGIRYLRARLMLAWDENVESRLKPEFAKLVASRNWDAERPALGLDMPAGTSDPFETMFGIWLRSSDAMRSMAAAAGAGYVHVVQPNQYAGNRRFSAAEAAVALATPDDHEYRVGVRDGYRLLESRRDMLAAHKIASAIHLFDDVPEPVYVDACCHYNARGETLFAEFVARQVETALSVPQASSARLPIP